MTQSTHSGTGQASGTPSSEKISPSRGIVQYFPAFLIALFLLAGTLRLNDCDLFNPDSPRYVIYSQAIVNLGGYQATDLPGAPIYTWRPPGLPILLAPLLALRPYDVVAAKFVVLISGALLLWVAYRLTKLLSGTGAALLVTAILASSPAFLVMSTEVLTEVPYALFVLIVIWILSRTTAPSATVEAVKRASPATPRGGELPSNQEAPGVQQTNTTTESTDIHRLSYVELGIGIIALAWTPWLRTAGVALVASVGIWSLLNRQRYRWLSGVALAAAGLGLLAWRNHLAAGENYVGSLFGRLRERGIGPMVTSGLDSILFYLTAIHGLIFPGFAADRPWYAPLTLDPLPTLGMSSATICVSGLIAFSVAMYGMWLRRANGGSLGLLYVVIYCGCLTVWPWRHERFLWPLIPVALPFIPAGLTSLARITRTNRFLVAATSVSAVTLVIWQAIASQQIISVNREFVSNRDSFYSSRIPGFYFSDWRRAGTWLNENTPPHSRVLTWHAAVGGTSHRFQKRVQFEATSPEKLRKEIESFSARYLVVPNAQFGDGFGWRQCAADPTLRLNVVYSEHDVTILEVAPNRSGVISRTDYTIWADQQLKSLDEARQRMPQRIDLAIRQAGLLRESGRGNEAIPILRELIDQGVNTVRVFAELGWLFFEAEDFAEAAKYLERAKNLPNAESIATSLTEGAERARERLRQKSYGTDSRTVESRLRRVKGLMSGLNFNEAECEINRILDTAQNHAEANSLRGQLHLLFGEPAKAEPPLERAVAEGNAEAKTILWLHRYGQVMQHDIGTELSVVGQREIVDPNDPAAHVRWADLLKDSGLPGRALDVLESASKRFPGQSVIELPLAELYLKFARPELALPIYEALLKAELKSEVAIKGIHYCRGALRVPKM